MTILKKRLFILYRNNNSQINSIFTLSPNNNLKSITDLANEFILKSLLVEM